jgi:hypothetical protein
MPQSEAQRRAGRAFVLRAQGLTYAVIAERLGYPSLEACFLAVAKVAGRDDTAPSPATAEERAEARKARRRAAAKVRRAAEKEARLAVA